MYKNTYKVMKFNKLSLLNLMYELWYLYWLLEFIKKNDVFT